MPGSLPRPKSVTVVSWLLIALAIIGLVVLLVLAGMIEFDKRFMPTLLVYAVASLIQIVMGAGMLSGKNWARMLFLWITPISAAIGFVGGRVSGGSVIMLIWYFIFAFYLTRPLAVEYFTGVRGGEQSGQRE